MTQSTSQDYYEVEAIMGKKIMNGKTEFLVKWKGIPENESTWEPLSHLQNCEELIKQFEDNEEIRKSYEIASDDKRIPRKRLKKVGQTSVSTLGGTNEIDLTDNQKNHS